MIQSFANLCKLLKKYHRDCPVAGCVQLACEESNTYEITLANINTAGAFLSRLVIDGVDIIDPNFVYVDNTAADLQALIQAAVGDATVTVTVNGDTWVIAFGPSCSAVSAMAGGVPRQLWAVAVTPTEIQPVEQCPKEPALHATLCESDKQDIINGVLDDLPDAKNLMVTTSIYCAKNPDYDPDDPDSEPTIDRRNVEVRDCLNNFALVEQFSEDIVQPADAVDCCSTEEG